MRLPLARRTAWRALQATGGALVFWLVASLEGCVTHHCEGSTSDCWNRAESECGDGQGCGWRVGCRNLEGFVGQSCSSLREADCLNTPTCSWGGDPACFGLATSCPEYEDEDSCHSDPNCAWTSRGPIDTG